MDGTYQCLPPAKYLGSVYKVLSSKQKEWLWQECKKAKADGEDIPVANKRCRQSPAKQAKRLELAMVTQKHQISSLTAQNKNMIVTLIASGIEIPNFVPSLGKEDNGDCKIVANKKNSNFAKNN